MAQLLVNETIAPLSILPLENERRLIAALNQVADSEFAPFFHEVWRCFISGALNSAVVWLWCAVSCYVRAVVLQSGEEVFRLHLKRDYKSLSDVKDEELIKACREMGMLELGDTARFGWLDTLRNLRNTLAHGNWQQPVTPTRVVELAEEATRYLFCHSVKDQASRPVDTGTVYKIAQSLQSQISDQRSESLVDSISDKQKLQELCHRLIALYVSGDTERPENALRLGCAVYERLSLEQRTTVLVRAIKDTAGALGLQAVADEAGKWVVALLPEEEAKKLGPVDHADRKERFQAMLDFEWWADSRTPDDYRDAYYEIFVIFFSQEVEATQSMGRGFFELPHGYYSRIKKAAPEKYRDRIEELYYRL